MKYIKYLAILILFIAFTGSAEAQRMYAPSLAAPIPNDVSIGSTTAGKNLTVNATLGSELITWTDAGWNEDGATWTFAASTLTHVTGNTTTVTAAGITCVAGTTYKVTITGTGGGGTAAYTLGGATGTTIAASGAIAIEDFITASTTASLIITPASACTVAITNISVKALTDATGDLTVDGNARFRSQLYFTSRTQSATYPLITAGGVGTLYFDSANSVWILSGAVYSPNLVAMSNTGFIGMGTSNDVRFYRDASDTFAQRRTTTQQINRIYNTYTDASNYERLAITGVQGASVDAWAETAGTGADNLDYGIHPAGLGEVKIWGPLTKKSATANTGGGLRRTLAEATSGALSGATGTISVNVPSGARIQGIQLRVDTAVTSDSGVSWTAVYVNTPTTAICSGQAFTKNTKFNAIHPAYEITTGTVTITVAPNAGNFTAGVIRAVVYYEDLVTLSDNP